MVVLPALSRPSKSSRSSRSLRRDLRRIVSMLGLRGVGGGKVGAGQWCGGGQPRDVTDARGCMAGVDLRCGPCAWGPLITLGRRSGMGS